MGMPSSKCYLNISYYKHSCRNEILLFTYVQFSVHAFIHDSCQMNEILKSYVPWNSNLNGSAAMQLTPVLQCVAL